ncbi:helix-turn-helix transcriptional regulator [Rhizobium sp. RU36D]|uniref:transcriptional regulator VisR n=1 Tax=Rhizobium sp. RU36D TaxID=1907415 RepID=UPI0009D80231|nr:helix-turn-helix transcriptional regulator [Rhizobium sp. RU36D]SMC85087.1 DNA-binding transcriptional regulator, CsgD family [Rhizobium sp. RU36D]
MPNIRDPNESGAGEPAVSNYRMTAGRTEIFPKLIAMQKGINARNFAVLRVSGSGIPSKRKLSCDFENWGSGGLSLGDFLTSSFTDTLLTHLESSLLPLVWSAAQGGSFVDASDFAPFVVELKQHALPFSGIAFPIRLGAIGNGYVLFATTASMDLPGEAVLDLHARCCKIMMDLLTMEERRMMPSESLSDREVACLQLAGDGRISEEIAEKLGLSVHTVNAYLGSATIKLDSVNRIQAIAKAIRLGYIN